MRKASTAGDLSVNGWANRHGTCLLPVAFCLSFSLALSPATLLGQEAAPLTLELSSSNSFEALPQAADPSAAPVLTLPAGNAGNLQAAVQNQAAGQNQTRVPGQGAETTQDAPSSQDSAVSLQNLIVTRSQQLASDTERSEEERSAIAVLHLQAVNSLKRLVDLQKEKDSWTSKANTAADRLLKAKGKRDALNNQSPEPESNFQRLPYDKAQNKIQSLRADLLNQRTDNIQLSEEITRRELRRAELPQAESKLKSQLEMLQQPAQANEADPLLAEAQAWSAEAKRLELSTELMVLAAEQLAYEAESSLLPIQAEIGQVQESRLQEQISTLEQEVGKRRMGQIASYARQFDASELTQYPELSGVAKRIGTWLGQANGVAPTEVDSEPSTTWPEVAMSHARIKKELVDAQIELEKWTERRAKMETRVGSKSRDFSVTGFNSWIGLMLRKQRGELPQEGGLISRLATIEAEIHKADALIFELDDATSAIRRESSQSSNDSQVVQTTASRDRFASANEILSEMKIDIEAYTYDLYELANAREEALRFSSDYGRFIDKHILWIRSSETLKLGDLNSVGETFRWLFESAKWRTLGMQLVSDSARWVGWYVIFAAALFLLLANRMSFHRQLEENARIASRKTCTRFGYTVRALVESFLMAAPLPLLLLFLAWRLDVISQDYISSGESDGFARAIAMGCLASAATLFPFELLRSCCSNNGLALAHFDRDENNVATLRGNILWFVWISSPMVFLSWAFASQAETRFDSLVSRLVFIVLMIFLSLFIMRVFWPSSGIFHQVIANRQGGWADRLKYVWYPVLIFMPIVLGAISFLGFHYTAQRIAAHCLLTLWTILALAFTYGLLKRWLLLSRRQLMMDKARQRLELAAQADSSGKVAVADTDSDIDLVAVNEQTKRLVLSLVVTLGLVGAYLIWKDVLPAVSVLDRFELWVVKGATPEDSVSITLAHLLMVVPVVLLTVVATRNVPGLLEIAFLQHLPLTNAARYAIATLARYLIVAVGIAIGSSMIGLQWSSIQWLVAALGVGLGFGLQEIFANFVSGIILLFEQPIRVGDIITIDGTTGTVAKIRIRATTVVNWDRQELVIPNKDLITGTLLNWTLTDTTNRVVVNVGVAYGANVSDACRLIKEIASEHPDIMNDPAPNVTFEGFGDNTLNLVLRAYLETLDNRLGTIHALHQQIYIALSDAQIEIAFPQRDLHVRSLPDSLNKWLTSTPRSPIAAESN